MDKLADITARGWIMAYFIRSDGERFLLGTGAYDFKSDLQHFQPNTMANDIVELQGTDGQLIAGQVRRSATQSFNGYVGDSTQNRERIEELRRDFLMFFRKNFFYKTVYIYPNGTAIQRKRGYLVDAPSVPELYQFFPEYHVALNYEDPNYYEYAEDAQGDEIFANILAITLTTPSAGGLVWDAIGAVSHGYIWSNPQTASGSSFQITSIEGAPLTLTELKGNAEQQTYSGKNLAALVPMTNGTLTNPAYISTAETVYDSTLKKNVVHLVANGSFPTITYALPARLESDKYYSMTVQYRSLYTGTNPVNYQEMWFAPNWSGNNWDTLGNLTNNHDKNQDGVLNVKFQQSTAWTTKTFRFHVDATQYSNVASSYTKICFSMGNGILNGTTAKEVWIADVMLAEITQAQWDATTYTDENFEPYVGGTASPNPDYPQPVNVVAGEQTITISDGTNTQSHTIDLGSIELAKIGNYQDRIYKTDGKWYIEKQTGKVVLDGSESYSYYSSYGGFRYRNNNFNVSSDNPSEDLICSHFTVATVRGTSPTAPVIKSYTLNTDSMYIFLCDGTSDVGAFKTWLASNPTTVYYALATPTTTEITDSTLLSQLNFIANLYGGTNNIMLVGTGAQGEIGVEYMTEVSTDGAGYEWQGGGGGGGNTITLDAVEAVRPVWEVIGPATNPTLTNITTGETISFDGTVPAGQTLTVDMDARTATMAGANVFQFITGDWLRLEPGNNRMSYTATGTTEPSTLSWNGVVG